MSQRYGSLSGKTIGIVCGKGNNGGDGLVVARLLKKQKAIVRVLLMAPLSALSSDAKTMYQRLVRARGKSSVVVSPHPAQAAALLNSCDVIVDALLGTGLAAPVTDAYQAMIEAMNASHRPIVAVDIPSGIHGDTGVVMGSAVTASVTVTFGLPKIGLFVGPGIDCAGSIHVVDIGIPPPYVDATPSLLSLLTASSVRPLIPRRRLSSHKGTYGHVGIIAGSVGKTGAATLASQAALRSGAGLVTLAIPSSLNDIVETKLLEVMTYPVPDTTARTFARSGLDRLLGFIRDRTAIALGPGLSTHPETVELVQTLLPKLDKPTVLDADALNALAGRANLLRDCLAPLILTPHPGEMARLEGSLSPQQINADRLNVASAFATRYRVVLILKGARTVVAHPDGRLTICSTGNPGMATAGVGDVLTGLLAGLLAQGLSTWDAACAGTFLHGRAGDLAAEQVGQPGLTAGDLVQHIPHALQELMESRQSSTVSYHPSPDRGL
jgi:NAD(P)H-hydrate epimerase